MADFGRGIKAGVAVVGIYLIIAIILELTNFSDQFGAITMAAGLEIPLELTDPSFGIYLILVDIVPRVVRGIVFGAVFAALYSFLPGTASVKKGVVLSSFLWIITVIEVIYTTPGWPWHANGIAFAGTHYGGLVSLSSVGLALAGIISAVAFGALTGLLWDRFRPKRIAEARRGSPVLLVGFILGGVLWALSAVAFLIGVVIFGGPIIEESGPAWWYSILYTSVVFLGLPGWVLALAAWKKTKRGESGLKLGVAGGVIMALTGVMLLPGALAITGGIFSGRKPAIESATAETEQ